MAIDVNTTRTIIKLLRQAMDKSIAAPEAQSFVQHVGVLLDRSGISIEQIRFRSAAPTHTLAQEAVNLPGLQSRLQAREEEVDDLRAQLKAERRENERLVAENARIIGMRLKPHDDGTVGWTSYWHFVTARLGATHGAQRIFVDRYNHYALRRGLDTISAQMVDAWQKRDKVPAQAVEFAKSPALTKQIADAELTEQSWTLEEDAVAEALAAQGKTSNQVAGILTKRFGRKITVGAAKKALQRCRIRDAILRQWDDGETNLKTILAGAKQADDIAAYDVTERRVRFIIGTLRDRPDLLPKHEVVLKTKTAA